MDSKPKEKSIPKDFPQGILPRALPAIATHKYTQRDILELNLHRNERVHILEAKGEWWFIARTTKGAEGWVPSSYIRLLEAPATIDMRAAYRAWQERVDSAFRPSTTENPTPRLTDRTFPHLPPDICICEDSTCLLRKQERGLGACVHDAEALLRGAGEVYTAKWLWRMSLEWHPDKFVRRFEKGCKGWAMRVGSEMFGILSELGERER